MQVFEVFLVKYFCWKAGVFYETSICISSLFIFFYLKTETCSVCHILNIKIHILVYFFLLIKITYH